MQKGSTITELIDLCLRKYSHNLAQKIYLHRDLDLNKANEFLEKLRHQDRFSTELFDYYLTYLARKGYGNLVRMGIQKAEMEEVKSNNDWVNVHLQLHAASSNFSSSLSLLNSLSRANKLSQIEPAAIAFCVSQLGKNHKSLDLITQIWNKMDQKLDELNFVVEKALIKQYAKLGAIDKCIEILENIKEEGGKLDTIEFNSILRGCLENNKERETIEILERMKREGIPRNGITYTMLIQNAANRKNITQVRELVQQLRREKIPANFLIYTVLIKISLEIEGINAAKKWIEEMRVRGIMPTDEIYNLIIEKGLEKNMKTDVFTFAFEEMRDKGIKITKEKYKLYLEQAVKYESVEGAKWFLAKMRNREWEPTRTIYNNLISLAAKKGETESVKYFVKELEDAGVPTSRGEYNKLLQETEKNRENRENRDNNNSNNEDNNNNNDKQNEVEEKVELKQ